MIGTNEKTEFILRTMFHELHVFFTKMLSSIDSLEFNRHKLLFKRAVCVFGKGVMSTSYVTGTLNNSLSTLKWTKLCHAELPDWDYGETKAKTGLLEKVRT